MNKAFTFIESMIVIAMIGILSVIVIPSYQNAKQQISLQKEASKLAQNLRTIQERATSAKKHEACDPPDLFIYGIEFKQDEPNKYMIFADCNGNGSFGGNDEIIEEVFFEDGIEINRIVAGGVIENLRILFKPPGPKVEIIPGPPVIGTFYIELINENGQIKTITANKMGLIAIDLE